MKNYKNIFSDSLFAEEILNILLTSPSSEEILLDMINGNGNLHKEELLVNGKKL